MAKTRREKVRKEKRRADARAAAERAEMGGKKTPLKLPKGMVQFFFTDNKTYRLNILEYAVGKGNPDADYDPDDPYYYHSRKYFVHKAVGADEQMVACLKKNWNEPCPACEFLESIPREQRWGSQKDISQAISPKQRQIFALIDLDDTKKGIQIFENSYFFGLGEAIDGKILAKDRYKSFAQSEGGRTVEVVVRKNKKGGWDLKSIELEQRDDIEDSIMAKVPCLDELIIKPDYKEFSKLFNQGQSAKKKKDDDDSDDSDMDSSEEEGPSEEGSSVAATAKKINKEKSSRRPKKDSETATSSPIESSDEESSVEEASSAEESSAEEASSEEESSVEESSDEDSSSEEESSVGSEAGSPIEPSSLPAKASERETRTKK